MSAFPPFLQQATGAARQRRGAIAVLAFSAWLAWLAVLGWRLHALGGAIVAVVTGTLVAAWMTWRWLRRIDAQWIARRLDARRSDMDDSAALLFRDPAELTALQALQRERLHARLHAQADADLRDAWPRRTLAINAALAAAAILATLLFDPHAATRLVAGDSTTASGTTQRSNLDRIGLAIEPPPYTGLPARDEASLDGKAAQGSLLHWKLRISPRPDAATLSFHDGSTLALHRDGDDWSGERRLDASVLYRVELAGAPPLADQRLHRFDAVPDLGPEITVIEPERSLTLLAADQKTWPLRFEARDDYGLAEATLSIVLAQGGGENITFKEQTLAVPGVDLQQPDGSRAHARSYAIALDLATLGIAAGDDVIVRLAVGDNAQPTANTTRSASFILRWPPEAATDTVGMEGIVQNTLPAYFRSQRQIIIDSEKLVADKPETTAEDFMIRSDTIGVDQKILRLRYGQFLGEEFESGRASAAPEAHEDHDHEDHGHEEKDDKSGATQQDALAGDHDHDHAAAPAGRFGDAGNVLAEYGHTHDHAEAATLLDPETRRILKSALDEMWQAELHLRQDAPELALPYEYRALGYIKQVQQASRIYLARVGLELPEIDETRRLTGKRDDVSDRRDALVAATADNAIVASTWAALDQTPATTLEPLERWVRERDGTLPDALGLIAAIDSLRRDPAYADCRERLRAQLWPLLPVAAARATSRPRPDAAGAAWLDAVSKLPTDGARP